MTPDSAIRAAWVPLPARHAVWRDRALILALALLAQVPGLLHWVDSDPLLRLVPLAQSGAPGLLPGSPGWIDPNFGTTVQALGHLAAADWLSGHVPWWNPYSGIGVPLAAEMQPGALFLPFVLLLHFADGLLWQRFCMSAVAGIGAYELTRALGLRRAACLAAGLLFAFDGTLAWLPDAPSRSAMFLPWLLLGVERARLQAVRSRPLGWLWISVALALSLYAGFPETAYLDGLFAAAWSVWRLLWPESAATIWRTRARLFVKLAAGVAVGLLLAAPAVWPFLHYLGLAEVGLHESAFAHAALAANAFPMFLIPYLYGPLAALGNDPAGPLWYAWGNVGGYAGAAATVLGLLGLAGLRSGRAALRLILFAWIVLCLAKTAALPGATEALNLLPQVKQTAFFRYAETSWSMAAIVLAALAIDDWQRQPAGHRGRALAAAIAALVLLLAVLKLAIPTMRQLASHHHHGYPPFAAAAIGWFLALAVLLPLLAGGPPSRRRVAILLVLVAMDAAGMFSLPVLSATRGAQADMAPIRFLQTHLGLARFYALDVVPPNYGARFGIASINDNMVPVPANWAAYVRNLLDPQADATTFTGGPGRQPGPDARHFLLTRLEAYRALGVRYVITPPGGGSLGTQIDAASPAAQVAPLALTPGAEVSGHLPAGFAHGKRIESLIVRLGTYFGQANGTLDAALCTPLRCARGSADLRRVPDNVGATIRLDPPLDTAPGDALAFTLRRRADGAGPLALWLAQGSAATANAPAQPGGYGPALALGYADPAAMALAFRDVHADIFAVPDPAPYFSAVPGCTLAPSGRRALVADCRAPALLTRRELSFPGWRATVGSNPAALGRAGLFQTLALPAGRSAVRFAYAPPHITLAYLAALAGLAWMGGALLLAVRPRAGGFRSRWFRAGWRRARAGP